MDEIQLINPNDEEVRKSIQNAVQDYALRVGMVAYAWNLLVETLGRVFIVATGMDEIMAQAIWYAFDSDRSQIKMLDAALSTVSKERWSKQFPTALSDLEWLAERSMNLADARNNAIHAPCVIEILERARMVSDPSSGHQRAKNLLGRSVEEECNYCVNRAGALEEFARYALAALVGQEDEWPVRPKLPERHPKSGQAK